MSRSLGRVLVIDDDADTRRLFQKALKVADFDVLTAASGTEAWQHLESDPCPDVVLVDLSMPEMDGEEFLKKLRGHARCAAVKVALVSGWDRLAQVAEELGADGYVTKPVTLTSLQDEVKRLAKES